MKTYQAKTVEEAVELAAAELGMDPSEINYEVVEEEKKGLFSKKTYTINVYENDDMVDYVCEYLETSIETLGIQSNVNGTFENDIVKVNIDSDHNPVLIGKNGVTLQALNELAKLVLSARFKRRVRVLIDIGDYKDKKYSHLAFVARKTAKEVQKTKVNVKLNPMTPDERRIVHNALSSFSHIKTESEGEGNQRAIVIKYVA